MAREGEVHVTLARPLQVPRCLAAFVVGKALFVAFAVGSLLDFGCALETRDHASTWFQLVSWR